MNLSNRCYPDCDEGVLSIVQRLHRLKVVYHGYAMVQLIHVVDACYSSSPALTRPGLDYHRKNFFLSSFIIHWIGHCQKCAWVKALEDGHLIFIIRY